MQFLLVSYQGHKYGLGHHRRMSILGTTLSQLNQEVDHFCFLDDISNRFTELEKFLDHSQVRVNKLAVIVDIPLDYYVENSALLINILKALGDLSDYLIIYDSPRKIMSEILMNILHFDLILIPYGHVGRSKIKNELWGFGWSILDPEIELIRNDNEKGITEKDEILITAGGSDPSNIGEFYLNMVNQIPYIRAKINFIVGPWTKNLSRGNIEQLIQESPHQIQLFDSPPRLVQFYERSGLALISSGITRTEVMSCGIPALVTNYDFESEVATKIFSDLGSVINLGVLNEKSRPKLMSDGVALLKAILDNMEVLNEISSKAIENSATDGLKALSNEILGLCQN